MPFAVASGIGTGIAGIAGAAGSIEAAKIQADAAKYATNVENAQFDITQQNFSPFLQAGTNALPLLQQALGIAPPTTAGGTSTQTAINPALLTSTPGYQFQLQQGLGAIQNQAAARGGLNSGNTLKALTNYGQGLASTGWSQWLGNLTNLVGSGQNAAGSLGSLGAANANQVGSNAIGAGNAAAAGLLGATNSLTGGINNGINNALLYQLMNNGGGGGGTSGNPFYSSDGITPDVVVPSNYYAGGTGGPGY